MKTALLIARQEAVRARRSRAFHVIAAVSALLLVGAVLVGLHQHRGVQEFRARCQEMVDRQWAEQPDRHPHRVAHYGNFAFRPRSPLSFLDVGVDSFTGSSIYLEAHHQNAANFSEARHSTAMLRFGELSTGLVLQLLVPLLLCFLVHDAVTSERESGTLPMLLMQGVSFRSLLAGKVLGLVAITGLAVLPAVLGTVAVTLAGTGMTLAGGIAVRLGLLASAYLVYMSIWVLVAVLVSACHRTSRGALLTLLSGWVMLFVVLPRVLPNIGDRLHPAPARPQFSHAIRKGVAEGGDGHNIGDAKFEELKNATLAKHGAKTLDQLPFNYRGVTMRAGEDHSSRVYQEHFSKLQDTYKAQNRLASWAGLIDPYLALRDLSMSLCGTDFHHFVAFQRAAEQHRFEFVQKLNELHTHKIHFKGDKDERLDKGTWKEFAPFTFNVPGVRWALGNVALAPLALALWVGGLVIALARLREPEGGGRL